MRRKITRDSDWIAWMWAFYATVSKNKTAWGIPDALLQVVIENYGDITRKTYDDESAAINDLLREFATGGHAPHVATLALGEWTQQLAAANDAFIALMRQRYGEIARDPDARMKDARAAVDNHFRAMIDRLEAIITLNGIDFAEELAPFVNEYNALAGRYKHVLAVEKGRRDAAATELPATE
jgi:hypothetical protein